MRASPGAINTQPPGTRIHSYGGTGAGCHDVPDPAWGEGSDDGFGICIPSISIDMDCSLPFMEGAPPGLCAPAHTDKTSNQANGNTILRKVISYSRYKLESETAAEVPENARRQSDSERTEGERSK